MEDEQKTLAYKFGYLKRFERRYMLELSRLIKVCRDCPFVENCQNKRMQAEALAYLPMAAEAGVEAGMSASMPLMRETMTIMIQGNPTVVYKDDIQKELERHLGLYPSLFKELC